MQIHAERDPPDQSIPSSVEKLFLGVIHRAGHQQQDLLLADRLGDADVVSLVQGTGGSVHLAAANYGHQLRGLWGQLRHNVVPHVLGEIRGIPVARGGCETW